MLPESYFAYFLGLTIVLLSAYSVPFHLKVVNCACRGRED
jgi:hypothetical protein